MAKRGRSGGRVTPKGTRPAGWEPKQRTDTAGRRPPFADEARAALRERSPLALMVLASNLHTAVTAPRQDDEPPLDAQAVFAGMALSGVPELAALALAIAELHPDRAVAAELAAVAAPGAAAMRSPWLDTLADIVIDGCTALNDPFGDHEQLTVSWHWPAGQSATLCTLVDHDAGHALAECFVMPVSIDRVRADLSSFPDGPDMDLIDLDAAATRARLETAIARVDADLVTDTWPLIGPLAAWVLRHLPGDGPTYVDAQWSDADCRALVDDFVASPHATTDAAGPAVAIVEHMRSRGNGDAARISPVVAAHLLDDVAGLTPDVVRAWALFAAERRGLSDHLIAEIIEAIDTWQEAHR